MAGPADRPPRREDLVERFWRLFGSPRLAVGLAVALTAAWAAGTLLGPWNADFAEAARSFSGRWWWAAYVALELHDPVHSWWFTLLLVVLALDVLALSVERLPRIALAAMKPDVKLTEPVERGLRRVRRISAGTDPAEEATRAAAAFRAHGYEPREIREGSVHYLFAERGRASRLAACAVAAGLLTLLGGGIAGRLLDDEGTAEGVEGTIFDSVIATTATGETYPRRLPFAVRVNRFDVKLSGTGAPGLLRVSVSILRPDGWEIRQADVNADHPLFEQGIAIRQAGAREIPGEPLAVLVLVDKKSGLRQEIAAGRGEEFGAGGVTFSVEAYAPRFGSLGPAVQVRRSEAGRSTTFWVFEQRPDFDALNRPDRLALEFRGLRKRFAVRLQAVHRRGTAALLAGAIALLAGLAGSFGTVHRRLWVRVEPGRIVLAGATHRASSGFERAFEEIGRDLSDGGGPRG